MGNERPQVADEGDWLELLIASERTQTWLDLIRHTTGSRHRTAVLEAAKAILHSDIYAEEARKAGIIDAFTFLIAHTGDEEIVSVASAAISKCCGPMAEAPKVQNLVYGSHCIKIYEGMLSDGLGARLWVAGHIMCRFLVCKPDLVQGMRVLELGSGCGLCGILAAKMGAEVTLTDYDAKILTNLKKCVAGNAIAASSLGQQRSETARPPFAVLSGDSVDARGSRGASQPSGDAKWDLGGLKLRYLDWAESLDPAEARKLQQEDSNIGKQASSSEPPKVQPDEKFPVIIGSDLIYELYHADLIAAVICHRLAKGGSAYIALAVRQQAHLDCFMKQASDHRLQTRVAQAKLNPGDVGIIGREHEYEGGFVIVTVEHMQ